MDIEAFVKNGIFEFKETTLNGTVTTSDFNYSYILNQNISTSTTDKTRNSQLTASGPSSSKASSSNLQVDGGNPVAMNITNESNLVASLDMKSNTETNTSCYQSLNYQAGGKNYGTFNGEQVVASYNYTTEDYKKLMEKQGQTVTMCQ